MKKLFLIIAAVFAVAGINAGKHTDTGTEVPAVANVFGRESISLNGKWSYIVDRQDVGYYDYRLKPLKHGFFENRKPAGPTDLVEYDFDSARTIDIPSDWNTKDDRLFFYEGTVWFKRGFNYNKKAGRRALLYFGAVNYKATVWVNGKYAGCHEGGFTPFNFDVTEILREGENLVVVMVNNERHQDNIPTKIFDWFNYGGITRDVMLVEVGDSYIEDYYVQLDKGSCNILNCMVKMNAPVAGVKISLNIPELKIKKFLVTDGKGVATIKIKSKPALWSPENPKLYNVEITQGTERIADEIGFRTIETRGKQIFLNGEKVFLRGVSIHEEAPFVQGRAYTKADADTLLTWAKEMGCNYVRLAHYPHNERMVREAERMGIMVWSEIPVYWTISWNNPDTYLNAQRQLHDMIERDKNRANVIIWSIANETPHSDARDTFLSKLACYARTRDSIRLISMAMEVTSAENYRNRLHDNLNKYVDVISFNEYVGWYRDVDDAPKMVWEIPYNKPVIISEFGGGAVAGRHGDKNRMWTEEYQEELYRQNLNMLTKIDGLSGLSPWILVDFRSPRRPLDGVQNFFNRKGLISDKGQKKKAYRVMKEFYERKRNE